MTNSIVCGVDDSESARGAVRVSARLSKRLGLRQVLVHVASAPVVSAGPVGAFAPPPLDPNEHEKLIEAGRAFLEQIASQEGLEGVTIRAELGDPAGLLVTVAEEEGAEMLAVGSRGRGRLAAGLLGSVSSWVAANATCPVLVAPEAAADRLPGDSEPLVCGVDESENASEALRFAARLSERLASRLVLVHVIRAPTVPGASAVPGGADELHEHETRKGQHLLAELVVAEQLGTRVERRVVVGQPAAGLAEVADEEGAALLVVAGRGRSGLKAALLGSVSAELAGRAPCPVVVVSPRGAGTDPHSESV